MKYEGWKIPYLKTQAVQALEASGIPALLARLLASRGIAEPEGARRFLYGQTGLLDPYLLRGMDRAVKRLKQAVDRGEKVAVYGDYDVDGITSSCLMADCLTRLGLDCAIYIPDRIEEGYGLNTDAVEALHGQGVSLIVTVDCGVTAAAEALHAASLGVDMIITDHHECQERLPEAVAVIDPKRQDCAYPNKNLAGVGVAFKLACALTGDERQCMTLYGDLAAVGTIADIMPVTGENREIIKQGLDIINTNPRPGFLSLIEMSGIGGGKRLTPSNVSYSIAPRINAAGRLGRTAAAVSLISAGNAADAERSAAELCDMNRRRQAIEQDIMNSALLIAGQAPARDPLVLCSDDWHQGIVGIVASRLADVYKVPVVMITFEGDAGKGSCRSYNGFNLFDALQSLSDHLESFGGHAMAAGLNIRRDRVGSFRAALAEYYAANRPKEAHSLELDLCADSVELLDIDSVRALELLEPYGNGNPVPQFCFLGAVLESVTPIGQGKHLKLTVSKSGRKFSCVYFSMTRDDLGAMPGDRVDIAFTPQLNEYRLHVSVQLHIIDIRRFESEPLCVKLITSEALDEEDILRLPEPARDDFTRVWRRLNQRECALSGELWQALDGLTQSGTDIINLCVCLNVFAELGLISLRLEGGLLNIAVSDGKTKVNLDSSKLVLRLKAR